VWTRRVDDRQPDLAEADSPPSASSTAGTDGGSRRAPERLWVDEPVAIERVNRDLGAGLGRDRGNCRRCDPSGRGRDDELQRPVAGRDAPRGSQASDGDGRGRSRSPPRDRGSARREHWSRPADTREIRSIVADARAEPPMLEASSSCSRRSGRSSCWPFLDERAPSDARDPAIATSADQSSGPARWAVAEWPSSRCRRPRCGRLAMGLDHRAIRGSCSASSRFTTNRALMKPIPTWPSP